jgi:hypothetical protein
MHLDLHYDFGFTYGPAPPLVERQPTVTCEALMKRESFFATAGLLIAVAATFGEVRMAPAENLSEAKILSQADARIHKSRTGEAVLRLLGPSGKPIRAGLSAEIGQTRHKFLFGADIFMLDKCKVPSEEAAYEKEFADLLNYATLPFYWWMYEPGQGHPRYAETEQMIQWCDAHHVTMKGHPLA